MELVGVYPGCFGFSDDARSVARFVFRKQNPGIWTLFWPRSSFGPSAAKTAGDDTTGSQRPGVPHFEGGPRAAIRSSRHFISFTRRLRCVLRMFGQSPLNIREQLRGDQKPFGFIDRDTPLNGNAD